MPRVYQGDTLLKISKSLPVDQNKWEVRICVWVITSFFVGDMFRSALYILSSAPIPLVKAANLSHMPMVLGIVCLLCSVLALPHLFSLTFHNSDLSRTKPRELAVYGAVIASLFWLYIAGVSSPLDIGIANLGYWFKALGCLIVGYIYGHSINSQQNREAIKDEKPALG